MTTVRGLRQLSVHMFARTIFSSDLAVAVVAPGVRGLFREMRRNRTESESANVTKQRHPLKRGARNVLVWSQKRAVGPHDVTQSKENAWDSEKT